MLTGEGNENCEIQTIGLIAARSFVHFLRSTQREKFQK